MAGEFDWRWPESGPTQPIGMEAMSLWCTCRKVGLHGNTHIPFSDLNNKEVADLMSKFLAEKKLDGTTSK